MRAQLGAAYLRKTLEWSLKALGTDYVDIYFIHWPDPAVARGSVDTEMLSGAYGEEAAMLGRPMDELRAEWAAAVPLGRLAQPRDIADAFLLLASEEAAYITGATLRCDGGTLLV